MRALAAVIFVGACADPYNGQLTPEQAAKAPNGHLVVVVGTVFATSWDSVQASTSNGGDTMVAPIAPDYADTGAKYPRTPDHYVLVRTKIPPDVVQGEPGFTPGALADAWVLGVHLTDIDPAVPMPELGSTIMITGTLRRETWNQREIELPIVDDAPTIDLIDGPPPLAGPGDACTLDEDCNARLVCDRASQTCVPPPREIYWADPWHDVNGACDTDADCPLGQFCDASYAIPSSGTYAATYLATTDDGRHLCRLNAGATVAAQCPRIYTTADLAGARFVTGKEICVRGTLLTETMPSDGDTHDQMHVVEPIPYPTDGIHYELFGATTENGPIYKNPALPGGPILDPAIEQDVVAIGTYRYDPDHGWYEVHPVKGYLPPP